MDERQHQGCFCGNVQFNLELPPGVYITAACDNCPPAVQEDLYDTIGQSEFDLTVIELERMWNDAAPVKLRGVRRWRKMVRWMFDRL